jgi:hypothetical protein
MMAFFITRIKETFDIEYEKFHCICHSLGAHPCGWTEKRLKSHKIGRISGLTF